MRIRRQIVVFDAADIDAESRFWAGVLNGTVNADTDGDWNDVVVEGKTVVAAQLAPNHVPPDWPDGAPQQIHLDLHVDDPRAAHDEVLALGARMLQSADFDAPEGFRVYADPAGHPFCLCWS
jgi:hypothetical protein